MADYVVPAICKPNLDLSTSACHADSRLQEAVVAQALDISGTPINVFKLLGVHEQGLRVDLARNGQPIASSSQPGYHVSNIFNANPATWRSVETGTSVLTSYVGYNFGTKKLPGGQEKYAPPAPVFQHITSFKIQQGSNPLNRVAQVRVERSNDGVSWHFVAICNLPNTDQPELIKVTSSAPARFWRLKPTLFNGGGSDFWEVQALELYDVESTDLSNIQDKFLMENRDRAYAQRSVMLKAQYELADDNVDLTRFGIQLANQYRFTASFARMIEKLNRPIVIGDIIELPAELQFDKNLNAVHRWLEVTETMWDPQGYTTDWRPTLMSFNAEPLLATQETRDLLGWTTDVDSLESAVLAANPSPGFATAMADSASENIKVAALDAVPEIGEDSSGIASGAPYVPQDRNPTYDGIQYSVEDGLPPNNAPYTEGPTFPANPADGDYHRLTYDPALMIPPRLHRWSMLKNRWIFLEEDRRAFNTSFKPGIARILQSPTKRPL